MFFIMKTGTFFVYIKCTDPRCRSYAGRERDACASASGRPGGSEAYPTRMID